MALDHFNLSRPPFSALPDPAFHYEDAARRELLGALQYALRLGDGVIKVTGEPGSGKTMLCRVLAKKLAQAAPPVRALLLERPVNTAGIALSPQDAVCAIARQLGLDPAGLRSDEIMRLLHSRLAAERAAGKLAVLLVEESQALPADTLETLRQLTNLSEGPHNLLPVVLLGTPELSNVLRQPKLRQLRERITLSFVLPALPPELAPELLACRLRAAGHADGALFQLDAAKLIARTARADLRAVMALAARSVAVAAEASAPAVAMLHVRDAIKGSSGHSVFDAAPEALSPVISVAPLPQVTAIGQDEAVPQAEVMPEPAPEAEVMPEPAPDAGVTPLPAAAPEATPVPEPTAAAMPGHAQTAEVPPLHPPAFDATQAPNHATEAMPGPAPAADMTPVAAPAVPSTPQRAVRRSALIASAAMLAVAGAATAAFLLRPAAAPVPIVAGQPAPPAAVPARPPVQMALAPTASSAMTTTAQPLVAASVSTSEAPATAAPPAVAAYTRGLAEDAPAKPAAVATAVSAEPPAPPPAPRKPTLLKQSLLASKTWLRDEPENNFCVQIENFPASEPARVEKFLADTRAAMGLSEVHTYPMLINGERRIAIVYGSFASAKKVLEVQATLAERSGTHHKIRTIKGIRQAIAKADGKKQANSTS